MNDEFEQEAAEEDDNEVGEEIGEKRDREDSGNGDELPNKFLKEDD